MCGHRLSTRLACCKHSLGVNGLFLSINIHEKGAWGKIRGPMTDTSREEMTFELDPEGGTHVCWAKEDWQCIPHKGDSRSKGRKGTSPPSIQEMVGG